MSEVPITKIRVNPKSLYSHQREILDSADFNTSTNSIILPADCRAVRSNDPNNFVYNLFLVCERKKIPIGYIVVARFIEEDDCAFASDESVVCLSEFNNFVFVNGVSSFQYEVKWNDKSVDLSSGTAFKSFDSLVALVRRMSNFSQVEPDELELIARKFYGYPKTDEKT